jgi:hypothetical protein
MRQGHRRSSRRPGRIDTVVVLSWFKRHFGPGTLISGIACSLIAAALWEWGPSWLSAPIKWAVWSVWSAITGTWFWLTADVTTSRWWYWTLTIYLFGTATWVAYMVFRANAAAVPRPKLVEYTMLKVLGAVWRWRWSGDREFILDLTPFCPECDRQLSWGYTTDIASPRDWHELACRQHGPVHHSGEPYEHVEAIVKDEILLRLRNGTWVQVVEAIRDKNVAASRN